MATTSQLPTNQDLSLGQAATTSNGSKILNDTSTEQGDGGGKSTIPTAVSSAGGQDHSARVTNAGADVDGRVPNTDSQQAPVPAQAVAASSSSQGDDVEKDKGSMSTTLAGTMKDTQQTRKANNKLPTHINDEKAKFAASPPVKSKSPSTRSNPSLFSKLVRKLVPCIGPSRAHPIEVDDAASGSTAPESTVAHQEKTISKDAEKVASVEPTAASTSVPIVAPTPIAIPPLSPDAELIVPSTPTKQLLPQEETEGVTSGAVQPPGSTGEELAQDHSRHESGEESEGTSYTEDDDVDDHLDDEDDEDRLIMNGGAGIPIGPVCLLRLSNKHTLTRCLSGWSTKTTSASHFSGAHRTQVSST